MRQIPACSTPMESGVRLRPLGDRPEPEVTDRDPEDSLRAAEDANSATRFARAVVNEVPSSLIAPNIVKRP